MVASFAAQSSLIYHDLPMASPLRELVLRPEAPMAHSAGWSHISRVIFDHVIPPYPTSLKQAAAQIMDVIASPGSVCPMTHPFAVCCQSTIRVARAVRVLSMLIGEPPYSVAHELELHSHMDLTSLCDIFREEVGRILEGSALGHDIDVPAAPDDFLLVPSQLWLLLEQTVTVFLPNRFMEGLWEKEMYDHSPSAPISCRYWCVHAGYLDQALCPEVHIPSPFSPLLRGLAPSRQHVHTSLTLGALSCYEPLPGIRRYTSICMQGMIRWSTPVIVCHKICVSVPGRSSIRLESWNQASFFFLGEQCCLVEKYFHLTIRRNIEEIIQMGPDMELLDLHPLSFSKREEILRSMRYVLLGCHMLLSAFCDNSRSIPATPEFLYIQAAVRSEYLSLFHLNYDIFCKRFPAILVRILTQYVRTGFVVPFGWSGCSGHVSQLGIDSMTMAERRILLRLCGFYR